MFTLVKDSELEWQLQAASLHNARKVAQVIEEYLPIAPIEESKQIRVSLFTGRGDEERVQHHSGDVMQCVRAIYVEEAANDNVFAAFV